MTIPRAPAARTSASGSRATCAGTWPTSRRAATRACSTRSRRTTSPTTATRWPRSSRPRTPTASASRRARGGSAAPSAARPRAAGSPSIPRSARCSTTGAGSPPPASTAPPTATSARSGPTGCSSAASTRSSGTSPRGSCPAHVGVDDAERWTCRCDRCAERFGGPVPGELTPGGAAFREESVVDFLREIVDHVAARGGANTICLLPATEGTQGLADWDEVAAHPGPGDARDGSVLEALGRAGRAVRAPLRPPPARDGRASRRRRAALGAELRPRRDDIPELEAAVAARARGRRRRPLDVGLRGVPPHDRISRRPTRRSSGKR